jgi:hypothetical protein
MARASCGCLRRIAVVLAAWLASGCAASVSEIRGLYTGPAPAPAESRLVRVEFTIAHLTQRHGFDAVPKHRAPLVTDFEELFRDATHELPNVSAYTLKNELAPGLATEVILRPDYRTEQDYSVRMVFLSESSFAQDVLAALLSLGTLSVVPAPFPVDYTASAEVRGRDGRLLGSYTRSARVTQWIEGLLIFAYPFRPPEGEREKLVSHLLRDLFREMAAKGVLAGSTS